MKSIITPNIVEPKDSNCLVLLYIFQQKCVVWRKEAEKLYTRVYILYISKVVISFFVDEKLKNIERQELAHVHTKMKTLASPVLRVQCHPVDSP